MSADHSERRRFDPSRAGKGPPPRRTSGGHAPIKRTSGAQPPVKRSSGAVPTGRAPSERIAPRPAAKPAPAPAPVPAPAAPARPSAAKAKRTTGAQRPATAVSTAAPLPAHESQPAKKASVAAAAPASARTKWKALVGLLAAACVGLGATAGWLWFGTPPASSPETGAVTKAGPDTPGERSAVPVSNSGRTPAAEEGNAAKFIGRDEKLAGSWKQRFGGDGYVIFNRNGGGQHEVQLPTYLSEVTSTGDGHVWAVNDDARGLEDPNDPKKRYQTCMYSSSDILLSIKAARPLPYRVSVYCLDGDRLGRKQKVEVLDGDKVLNTQDIEEMGGGVWLTWEFRGSLDIRFTNTGPHNAVLAGVFFDTDEKLKIAKRSPPKGPMPGEGQLKAGVWAEYFDQLPTYPNVKDVATVRRVEPGITFGAMQALQPGQGLRDWPFAGACAAIFSGYVKIPEDGAYTFFVESDDGARLYIDGDLAVDNDGRHPMKEASKRLDLKAGLHRVWVEYFNAEAPMGLNVYFQGKDGKKGPIPEDMLLYDPSEVLSESTQPETAVARR